jgi:hypothetical protein
MNNDDINEDMQDFEDEEYDTYFEYVSLILNDSH